MTPSPDTLVEEPVSPAQPETPVVPRVASAPRRRKLTRKRMATLAEDMMREHSLEVLTDWWQTVKHKIRLGDPKALEMVGRMYQYDRGPGGVTIYNQHLQVNNGQGGDGPARVRSFDQIVGKLEEAENLARQNRLIAATPLENSDDDSEEIMSGEPDEDESEVEEIEEIEDNSGEPAEE